MKILISAILFYIIPLIAGIALLKVSLNKKIKLPTIISYFLILVLTAVTFSIWSSHSPFPLNWDLYEHQTLSNLIQQGKIHFFISEISDTFGFNSYPPFFHTLLAIAQKPFDFSPTEILSFWNTLSFIHLFLVGVASYLLAKVIFKNDLLALISGILGTLVFDSVLTFTNLFVLPQTFTALLFSFALGHLIQVKGEIKNWRIAAILTLLILNHYIIGSIAAFLYLITLIFYRNRHRFKKIITPPTTLILSTLLAAAIIYLPKVIDLSHVNQGEATAYTFSLADRFEHFSRIYGYAGFIFLPIGLFYLLFKGKRKPELLWIFFITILLTTLSVTPLAYSAKFFVLGRFFVNLTMAGGIYWLMKLNKSELLQGLALVLLVSTFLIQLIANSLYWKQGLWYLDKKTHLSLDEIAAAEFLKENYDFQDLIISDPSTQYILEALSGVNSAGGVFASSETRELLSEAYSLESNIKKNKTLNQIQDKLITQPTNKLFIASGRYFLWQKAAENKRLVFDYNIWTPQQLTLTNIDKIKQLIQDNEYFMPIYQNKSLVIFKLLQ